MGKSTGSRTSRKAPDRPKKPRPDFPLSLHPRGQWQKKIRGRIYYFGRWARLVDGKLERVEGDGWREALDEYNKVADDLLAGRTPRASKDGLTVAALCNHFLTAKLRKREAGEIGGRMFAEYKEVTDLIVNSFGANRFVDDLAADDFAALRSAMARKWGPVRLVNAVTRVKSVFRFGTENGIIEKTVRFGSEFKKPDAATLRRHRAKSPPKMFEPSEILRLIGAAPTQLRAMLWLAINAGFGNHDCATVPLSAFDLDRGWVTYARTKTGIDRKCPLWPETVAAIRAAIAERPKPADFSQCGLTFITPEGLAWVRHRPTAKGKTSNIDRIAVEFLKLAKRVGVHRPGVAFYSVRHSHRTAADGARDQPAADYIMGHQQRGMRAAYVEKIDDARLVAVVEHVRRWLKGGAQ